MKLRILRGDPSAITVNAGQFALIANDATGEVCTKDENGVVSCFVGTAGVTAAVNAALNAADPVTGGSLSGTNLLLSRLNGADIPIDLSSFLDNLNFPFINSIVRNPTTNIVTFTRDDASVAGTIDLSSYVNPTATPRYEAFDSVGGLSLTPAYQVVPMNQQVAAKAGFALGTGGNAGSIIVTDADEYKYDYKVSSDGTDGDRATTQTAIFVNGVEVVRTKAYGYNRSTANGEDTADSSGVLILPANAIVSVRALILGDNVDTIANASNLVLEKNT